MMILSSKCLTAFAAYLRAAERSAGTIENYLRHSRNFLCWLAGRPLNKEITAAWKQTLVEKGGSAASINGKLVAVNRFLAFLDREDCRLSLLRVQRALFRDGSRELSLADYERLLAVARRRGDERLALVMETICATGIRVSELGYITVEAVRAGRADISLKGKIRTILLPRPLCKKLLRYAKKAKYRSGILFRTRNDRALSRKQIWAEMKALSKAAGVAPTKVYPHNLRHLFARVHYRKHKDVATLADLLGHSAIETTRLYLVGTGAEHLRQLDCLGLVQIE